MEIRIKRTSLLLIILAISYFNIQAIPHTKRINDYLISCRNTTTSNGHIIKNIINLYPLYNGYSYIKYEDSYNQERIGWLDVKNLRVIDLPQKFTWSDAFIAKGGFAILMRLPENYHTNESKYKLLYKIDGNYILDNVIEFVPFFKHFAIYRYIEPGHTLQFILFKNGELSFGTSEKETHSTIHSNIIFNKYLSFADTLYNRNLKHISGYIGGIGENERRLRGTFFDTYPHNDNHIFLNCLIDNDDAVIYTNEKFKKEITFYLPDSTEFDYDEGYLFKDDKYIVLKHNTVHVVYNTLSRKPITPLNHDFTGFFKDYLLHNYNHETFATSTTGIQEKQIKLGKHFLEKIGRKWLYSSPVLSDSIDCVIGLNNDNYIGVNIKNKVGIINKKGNITIYPSYEQIYIDNLYFICRTEKKEFDIYDKDGNNIGKNLKEIYYDNLDDRSFPYEFLYCNNKYKIDKYHYMFFKLEDGKYRYFLRKKKKSKVFYADEINTEDLSNKYLPIKKDGIWQYLEIK